ncbi:MAG: SDR family oxidoreductase [Sphingobium sp.]
MLLRDQLIDRDAEIRANCVAPGLIDTAMAEPIIGKDRAEGNENPFAHCPLGRAATVNEVASAVLFLASPLASYINGAVLAVDGGSSAKI